MKPIAVSSLVAGLSLLSSTAGAQVLFDFNNGPQYTSVPLDQISGGIRAHFTATGSGYSIQNIGQVIGMLPTGFSGLGLSPNSVFGADLMVSFFNASDSSVLDVTSVDILTAPQELACDSSSTMKISAFLGSTPVGSATAVAPADLNTYTWPTIDLGFTSAQPFDNVVIHFQSGPPTGGDWGGIFVADNMTVTPAPEPASMIALGVGFLSLAGVARRRKV